MTQDRIRETLEGYERDIVSLRAINAELLAALKEARTSLSRTRSAFTANGGLMSAIDAAIAKAEGK